MEEVEEEQLSAQELTKAYIKIRDARSELKAKFDEKDKVLKDQMEMIESKLLEYCKELGADNIKTAAGTVMRRVSTKYWTNDWDSLYKFIKENDAIGVLAQHIHQANMKQFLEENPDVFPPGMLVDSEYKIVIRRSK